LLLNKTDYYNTVKTVYYKQDPETGEWSAYDEEYEEWVEEGPRSYIGEEAVEAEEEVLEAEDEGVEAEDAVEGEEEQAVEYIDEEASSANCSLFLSNYDDDETYEWRDEASDIVENDAPLFIDPQMRVSTSSSAPRSKNQEVTLRHGRSRHADSRSPCRCDQNGCKKCDCSKPRRRQNHATSRYQDFQHNRGHREESHLHHGSSHHAVSHLHHGSSHRAVDHCHHHVAGCHTVHLVCSCARREYHTHCTYCSGRTLPVNRRVGVSLQ